MSLPKVSRGNTESTEVKSWKLEIHPLLFTGIIYILLEFYTFYKYLLLEIMQLPCSAFGDNLKVVFSRGSLFSVVPGAPALCCRPLKLTTGLIC